MKRPILNADGAPLAGQPKQRVVDRPIVPVHLQDADGACTANVQPDITALETYHITNLLLWCVTQPPPQQDKRTGDVLITNTLWRKYIADNKLERHFVFSDAPIHPTAGHA
jgi:hypothetical protein